MQNQGRKSINKWINRYLWVKKFNCIKNKANASIILQKMKQLLQLWECCPTMWIPYPEGIVGEVQQGESQEDQPPLPVQDITGNILGWLYERGCLTVVQQGQTQEDQPPLPVQDITGNILGWLYERESLCNRGSAGQEPGGPATAANTGHNWKYIRMIVQKRLCDRGSQRFSKARARSTSHHCRYRT